MQGFGLWQKRIKQTAAFFSLAWKILLEKRGLMCLRYFNCSVTIPGHTEQNVAIVFHNNAYFYSIWTSGIIWWGTVTHEMFTYCTRDQYWTQKTILVPGYSQRLQVPLDSTGSEALAKSIEMHKKFSIQSLQLYIKNYAENQGYREHDTIFSHCRRGSNPVEAQAPCTHQPVRQNLQEVLLHLLFP